MDGYYKYISIKRDLLYLEKITNSGKSLFDRYVKTDFLNRHAEYDSTQIGGKQTKKWETLKHNGVMFSPMYEPHRLPVRYKGEIINLDPEAEEPITQYVNPRFDKYRNNLFKKNFLKDWNRLLPLEWQKKITDMDSLDLSAIKQYVMDEIEMKKKLNAEKTKEMRDMEKKEKDSEIKRYQTAIVDGVEQAIDNYIVEPPTIFVGRGSHPLSGSIKRRLFPEDIILNIGKDMTIPIPTVMGSTDTYSWGEVISDPTLEWIASWQNNVTLKSNYARFGRKSSFKMKSDENKYDLAKRLKKKINMIREKNEKLMESDSMETRQLSTALFLIDRLALRIGNEKKAEEADTVGVTTLKNRNISFLDNFIVRLDFLGKDSIRYVNKFKVPELVYRNLQSFAEQKGKTKDSDLFDLVQADTLNKFIKRFMKNLTSKVFRTYNASYLMQIELKKIINQFKDYDSPDKFQKIKHLYDMANLKVAKLCNHQKVLSASTTGEDRLEKIDQKIKLLSSKMKILMKQKEKKIADGLKTTGLNKRIDRLKTQIKQTKNKKLLQTESKTLSAGTSKINYIDPRITVAFLKSVGLFDKISGFFNDSQQKLFVWAMDTDEGFRF